MKGTETGEGLFWNLLAQLLAGIDHECMSELQNTQL
jgi:hypothetical protein